MILTAIFIFLFSIRVAYGISKSRRSVSSILVNSMKKKQVIEIVIPQKRLIKKDHKTIEWADFLKERREEKEKLKIQKINLTSFPQKESELFLN